MVMVADNVPTLTPLLDDGLPPLRLLRPNSDVPQWDEGLQGEVKAYAGGQRASVTRLNSASTEGGQTVVTDAAGLRRMKGWWGQEVCYRDGLGLKVWAVFHRSPWTPSEDGALRFVQLRLESVTVMDES